MSIVSSIIVDDAPQKDGRRYITERHTDHLGKVYDVQYTARVNDDAQAASGGGGSACNPVGGFIG